jgi:hypothetical protein
MTQPLDVQKFVILPVKATAKEFDASEAGLKSAILAAIEKASAHDTAGATDPIGANGHPRMLQLSGWIVYADEINKNYRMFTPGDLEESVANGMFKAPFFGMIDYNHDFSLYGVWYDAKYAFDEVAGKWGIYAEGVMFAWRYTELADKMLAMQARQGHIDLSMACLAEYYESARSPEGIDYLIARKPVFFTTSLLDVEPAFPNARAYGTESPDSTPEQRADHLRNSDASHRATEEASMKNEDKAKTEEKPTTEVVTPETPKIETATDLEEEPKVETPKKETPVAETAATEVLASRVKELEGEKATATVALEAAKSEIEALTKANETLTAELAEFKKLKAEADAASAAEAEKARREARMAEIPEAVKAEMAKDENAALLDEWMGMEEAKWEATKKVFTVASAGRKTLAERSADEGDLATGRSKDEGGYAISKHVTPGLRRGKK